MDSITVIFRLPASVLLLTVFLAYAQSASRAERSTVVPDASMRSILRDMRLEFTEKTSDNSAAFDFQLNGHQVTLLNHIKDMQLSACFDVSIALMKINRMLKMNQWNQQHFSTRAYRDELGCASLGANMGFAGGVTKAMIEDYIREFSTSVTVFARFVAASPVATMAWSQSREDTRSAPPWPSATTSVPGLLRINPNITLRYDPEKWKQTPSHEAGHFALSHSSAKGHALIIAEPIAVPLYSTQDVALANAQAVDPSAKVVFRDQRKVNGVVLRILKIEAEVDAVPMVYWGYYYADPNSTVQVVTYTEKALLPEHEDDFREFLNGLAVSVF